ncbi:uncharacterized protein LOC134715874 [Mytilus trossulus]|uniref:uncharacterized protein LOC134715874 n=1 Tax=Mytilus trossulus TaxID=6551 RepID=UPI0030055964
MGRHGCGECNENGGLLVDLCGLNDLVIGGSLFPHKDIHKLTWNSPNGRDQNQIDHIIINGRWRKSLMDVCVKRGADCGSDHHLLLGKIKLKLRKVARPQHNRKIYNIHRLKDNLIRQKFNISIRNQYQTLHTISENHDNIGPDLNEHWNKVKTMFNDTAENVLGIRDSTRKRWISDATWNVIEKRRSTKSKCNQARSERLKEKLQKEYSELNKEVKKKAREDKLQYIEGLANEAEEACKHGELSTVYKITKQLCGKSNNNDTPVLSKNGEVITSEAQKLERWAEHFREVLNREPPDKPAQFDNTEDKIEIDISEEKIELGEIKKALCKLKNSKSAGVDNISAELLKADVETTASILQTLFSKIWEDEIIPEDWEEDY